MIAAINSLIFLKDSLLLSGTNSLSPYLVRGGSNPRSVLSIAEYIFQVLSIIERDLRVKKYQAHIRIMENNAIKSVFRGSPNAKATPERDSGMKIEPIDHIS